MVQIKIKGINNTYHLMAAFDDYDAFLIELKERLKSLSNDKHAFQAFFHLPPMSDMQLLQVFQVCDELHVQILGFEEPPEKKKIRVMEKDLFNGQTYHFQEPILLLGTIQSQAIVTTSDSLYVLGAVNGTIDFLFHDCSLFTSKLDANIRICDTQFQNLTSFSPVKVYYEKGKLNTKIYEEEILWERQLR